MSYLIEYPNGTENYGDFAAAREAAQAFSLANAMELEVVHAATNAVAFVATPVPAGRYFNPWERVETPTFPAPHIAGYRPAYTRKRIEATVYRSIDQRKWLIHDGRTGGTVVVGTTKEACQVTKEMRLGRTL